MDTILHNSSSLTLARLVPNELEPLLALAPIPDGLIHAVLAAAAVVQQALVDATLCLGFVLPEAAVVAAVAKGGQGHALAAVAGAVELGQGVAAEVWGFCKGRKKSSVTHSKESIEAKVCFFLLFITLILSSFNGLLISLMGKNENRKRRR